MRGQGNPSTLTAPQIQHIIYTIYIRYVFYIFFCVCAIHACGANSESGT
jgi:hypothetical protein